MTEALIGVLGATEWQHTVPVVTFLAFVVFCLLFKDSISCKIREVSVLRGEGRKWEAVFGLSEERSDPLPEPGQTVITQDEVRTAFSKIPDLSKEEIERYLTRVHTSLLRQGIVTGAQLGALVSADDVLDTLRELYVEELLRPRESPLDPVGVVAWAPGLLKYGLTQGAVEAVRTRIRQSPEYRQKHPPSGRTAGCDAG